MNTRDHAELKRRALECRNNMILELANLGVSDPVRQASHHYQRICTHLGITIIWGEGGGQSRRKKGLIAKGEEFLHISNKELGNKTSKSDIQLSDRWKV